MRLLPAVAQTATSTPGTTVRLQSGSRNQVATESQSNRNPCPSHHGKGSALSVVQDLLVATAVRPEPARLSRVVFVVCPSYHGATLLAALLNNHSQISALGDMLPLPGHTCWCGKPPDECPFWRSVAERLDVSRPSELTTQLPAYAWPLTQRPLDGGVVRWSGSVRLNRAAGRVARTAVDLALPAIWRAHPRPPAEFTRSYRSFYEFVVEQQGTSVFVDGQKSWRKAALLAQRLQPDVDVRIVHLLRDPRGFADSSRRHEGGGLRQSGWLWKDLHRRMVALQQLAPYHALRYEDLCSVPEQELPRLFDFIGVEPEDVVCPPKQLHKHHGLGNAALLRFAGDITYDGRWRISLTTAEQNTILRAAGPLARQYQYHPLRLSRPSALMNRSWP